MRSYRLILLFAFFSYLLHAQNRQFVHYTNNDGLPYSAITDFAQDNQGFMWVSMRNSVCRFDGYEFVEYNALDSAGKRTHLMIPQLHYSNTGNIYVSTMESRLFRYDNERDIIRELGLPDEIRSFSQIEPASGGGFWVLVKGRVIYLDEDNYSLTSLDEMFRSAIDELAECEIVKIAVGEGRLFLLGGDGKIYVYSVWDETVSEYFYSEKTGPEIVLFYADASGYIWISEADKGLSRISYNNGSSVSFSSSGNNSRPILHNMVRSISYDNDGKVWIGTENGLNIWDPITDSMQAYRYDPADPAGLNSNAIYKLYTDNNGNIWIGTYFGGINIWYAGDEFFSVVSPGFGEYDLGGKEVSYIAEDHDGNIWVGLEGNGLNMINAESGKIRRFFNVPGKNSLGYNNVHAILHASDDNIYIGTYTGGLNIYNPVKDHFSYVRTASNSVFPSDNIYSFFELGDSVFIGFDNGIVVLNTSTGVYSSFFPDIFGGSVVESVIHIDGELWISRRTGVSVWDIENNTISCIDEIEGDCSVSFLNSDSSGNIWIGDSYRGLFRYDRLKDTLFHYDHSVGFPASRVFGLLEGSDGWYWVSSSVGLIRFDPVSGKVNLYNTSSGLPFNQFNYNAFYSDSRGVNYFGGINGIVYFKDTGRKPLNRLDDIAFTGLDVFNERIMPGPGSQIEKPINLSRSIKLKYKENIFSVHFSALNFTHPGRVRYSYMLEGLNDEWINTGNINYVSFTSLSPGRYKLKVRASFDNYASSENEAVLGIIIKPPFLLSAFAYVIYGLIIIIIFVVFYGVSRKIEKTKALTLIERSEKIHEKKLSQAKLEFFTNVSHELKTPLTLIIGPLTNLVRSSGISEEVRQSLKQINDNAKRLLVLINQLMEFRKTDLGKTKLKVSEGDINQFAREIKESFDTAADIRNLDFSLENMSPFVPVWFDHEKLERILFNLLSNAFKYTHEGGRIVLRISDVDCLLDSSSKKCLLFEVEDNGIGIEEKNIARIFERFYKSDTTGDNTMSSGIGLALVNNLVNIHKGKIEVESRVGKGSVFRVWIPCSYDEYSKEEIACDEIDFKVSSEEMVSLELGQTGRFAEYDTETGKSTVMIIDDNRELLSFLSESIAEKYNIVTAENGIVAEELIDKNKPDIIISDIIMPGMDGYDLTRKIKNSIETSHIPVILLSAMTEVEDKFKGLKAGADAYIEKPFYPHLLLQHIENILSTRARLLETFNLNLNTRPSEIAYSKSDKEFIEKLSAIIHANIDNPDLDVSFLLSEMNISRSLLHLKLKKLANCSATAFIRTLRLREAANLLLEEGISFSEAAYRTGFSSPAFFSRRFKEYFGKTPSQFMEDARK